jgi:hypothetical protein
MQAMKKKLCRSICSQADTEARKMFSTRSTERKRAAEPLAVAAPLLLRKRPRWIDRDM